MISLAPFALASQVLLTGLALDMPLSADEEVIARDCLARGASETECACGINVARGVMTPREVSLLAALVPSLSETTELEAALLMAPQIAQQEGFSPREFAAAMQKVFEHSTAVEQQCDDEAAPLDPNGAGGGGAPQ